jgi:predicted regulator of Ras-like GTPase activity (Roadblock/LC7/MglB family)
VRDLEDILSFVVGSVDGAQFAALGSADGLLIAQHPKADLELSPYTAELTNVLSAIARLRDTGADPGDLRELMITSERLINYVRRLDPDLFLAIVMNPSGNLGKARLYSEQVKGELLGLLT